MTWHRGPLLAFDVESTGVDVREARIVTACCALIDGTGATRPHVTTWLVNPGVDIPAEATAIHGITTEKAAASGMDPRTALDEVATHLTNAWMMGTPVVAFNAAFDLSILVAELARHGLPALDISGPVIDPFVLDKQVDRYRKGKRTLSACCEHYGVRLDGAHDATADALAAARVAWALAERHEDLRLPLEELHAAQVGWAEEQAASFREYLTKQGKRCDDVDGAWPLRGLAVAS